MSKLMVLFVLSCALFAHADWELAKFAERDDVGEWDVGCTARLSGRLSLEWSGGVFARRAEMGDDPAKPVIVIDTLVTQSKSRPIEGEVLGEICSFDVAALDIVCEPASEEYQLRVSSIVADAPPRHLEIWVQPVVLVIGGLDALAANPAGVDPAVLAALPGGAVSIEFGVWHDWPDDLLEGDQTLTWRRGGTSPASGDPAAGRLDFNPVSASTELTNSAQLRRKFAACVSSHVRSGRIVATRLPRPHVRRLLDRIPALRGR